MKIVSVMNRITGTMLMRASASSEVFMLSAVMIRNAEPGSPATAPRAGSAAVGVVPSRDSAVIGFNATTTAGKGTGLYLRYDGDFSSATSSNAVSVGDRMACMRSTMASMSVVLP